MRIMSFFFSSRRRHTRSLCDWSSDVCSSDLIGPTNGLFQQRGGVLRIASSTNGFGKLLFTVPSAANATQEVLVRARITRLSAGDALPGGIAVAAATNDQSGFCYLFRS